MEQIVAVAIIGIVIPPLMLLISDIRRGSTVSDAHVAMLNLARSHIEGVKNAPFQDLPATYSTSTPSEVEYVVSLTAEAVKTYTYPAPSATTTLAGEIQLITVQVSCPDCSPPIDPIVLKDYKVRR